MYVSGPSRPVQMAAESSRWLTTICGIDERKKLAEAGGSDTWFLELAGSCLPCTYEHGHRS